MATVQLTLSDDEGERVKKQAQKEGITAEAWLTAAVLDRLRLREEVSYLGTGRRFQSAEELQEFWKRCSAVAGPGREPDWEEHLKAINESRSRGLPDV